MKQSSWLGTFLGKRIIIFFILVFCLFILRFSVVFFIFLSTDVLFSSSSNFEAGIFRKKMSRKFSSSTSEVDCHKMMLMIWWTSRYPGRFCEEWEYYVFRSSYYIFRVPEMQLQNPCGKKQHCHLHYAGVFLLKRGFRKVHSSVFIQKNEYFPWEWISSSDVFSSMQHSCCKN